MECQLAQYLREASWVAYWPCRGKLAVQWGELTVNHLTLSHIHMGLFIKHSPRDVTGIANIEISLTTIKRDRRTKLLMIVYTKKYNVKPPPEKWRIQDKRQWTPTSVTRSAYISMSMCGIDCNSNHAETGSSVAAFRTIFTGLNLYWIKGALAFVCFSFFFLIIFLYVC